MLLQTSLIHPATVSLTSLCLAIGRPPFGHERACLTDMLTLQAQWVDRLAGVHPYLRASASLKVPLCKVKPYSCRGRASSQLSLVPVPWLSGELEKYKLSTSSLTWWISRVFHVELSPWPDIGQYRSHMCIQVVDQ